VIHCTLFVGRLLPTSRVYALGVMGILVGLMGPGPAAASGQEPNEFDSVGAAFLKLQVAKPSSDVARRLERFERLVDLHAWDGAAELADQLISGRADGWVAIEGSRYVGVRHAVNRRLAELPADTLAVYRGRIDSVAEDWLREGKATRDEAKLRTVIDEAFCSSAGDDALWALGEMYLERGDYQAARTAWQRVRKETAPDGLPSYPDSKIDLAEVRARLALVSIREGDFDRAQREAEEVARLHTDAAGRLAGSDGNYAALLAEQIEEARQWTPVGRPKPPLEFSVDAEFEQAWTAATSPAAGSDAVGGALNSFPTVVADRVLFQDAAGVRALLLGKGPIEGAAGRPLVESARGVSAPNAWALAADHGRAFAVLPAIASGVSRETQSRLIGLDVMRDGALIFQQTPSSHAAVFLAPPVVRGDHVFVGELSQGSGIKAAVACFDLWKGTVIWRRSIGSAYEAAAPVGSPATGMAITEHSGVLFANTQLGMIAALRAADGEPLWLHTFKRSPAGEGGPDIPPIRFPPNPCRVWRSRVFAAPYDAREVLALDAVTGKVIWSKPLPMPGTRLLAVEDNRVILTGERLWALDAASGEIRPDWGGELSAGAGQGALADNLILWPTTAQILLVDRFTGQPTSRALPLPALGGANLVVASAPTSGTPGDPFVIAAGATHVTAYRPSNPADGTDAESSKPE
jgi:hypothetical protein